MKKLGLKLAAAALLGFGLSGCGGGDSGENGTAVGVNANGLWSGTQTINGVDYDISAIVYNQKIYGYSLQGFTMFSGAYTISSDNKLVSTYKNYDGYGSYSSDGSLTGTVVEKQTLTGLFSNTLNQTGTISASYNLVFEKPASLDYISGTITNTTQNFSISSSGAVSGTSNGCDILGQVTVPDTKVNIYNVNYTLSNCSYSGNYSGFGTIIESNGIYQFQSGMSNNTRMDLFVVNIDKPANW